MATLIDYTYFIDNLLVPNADDTGYAGSALEDQLQRYIAKYEPLFCNELLGETLGAEFYKEARKANPAAKWTALKSQIIDSTNKVTPIANYVWHWWYRDNVLAKTGLGDGLPQGQNINLGVHHHRMVDNWADMVRLNDDISEWMQTNYATYSTYAPGVTVYTKLNTFSL